MKKIISLITLVFIVFCGYAQQYVMTSKGYTIEGQVKKGTGYATLRTYLPDGNEKLDSTLLDKKGKFVFRGNVTEVMPALLTINGKKTYRVYLEPNLAMTMKINKKTDVPEFKNAPQTLRWYSIVMPQGKEDNEVYLSRLENWTINNPEDIFTCDIIANYLSFRWSFEQLDRCLNTLKGNATSGYYYKHLRKRNSDLEQLENSNKLPNITLKDLNNKQTNLQALLSKNKYVLIDFWATWSKEYIDNLQERKNIYNNYKDKGFEIYAVSLDNNKNLLSNVVKNEGIKWINVCDFKMWDSQPVKDYMIKSLPDNFLVSKEGKIVARNISNMDLADKLSNLLDSDKYSIAGNIEGVKEGIVKLTLLKKDGEKEVVERRINNSNFAFEGSVERVCMAMIDLPIKDGSISFFMGNDNIKITGNKKDLENINISGSVAQDEFQRISNNCNRNKNPMQCLSNYVLENPNSIYSPFILSNYLYPYMSDEDIRKAFASLNGKATTMFQYHLLKELIDSETKNYNNSQYNKAKDFSLENTNKKLLSLYSYIKKSDYTLLVFWASWDNNSRKNNIDYLRLYNSTKRNKFNILSISLDDNDYAWKQAIKTDGLRWENVSDLKRWNSVIVKLYNIKALPYTMLLDKEGNIAGENLSIEEIITLIK
ncbi:MAG: redoxin domain-containing protein [Bacteroidota bacterium]|nr:redoxin domain-containing protein [Bacteroidota bacterium]